MESILLLTDASVNGWLSIMVVACLMSAYFIGSWLRRDLLKLEVPCLDVMKRNSHRILAGALIMLFALGVRYAAFWPLRTIAMSGNDGLEVRYWRIIEPVATFSSVAVVIGLSIIMWPAIRNTFGRWSLPVILGGSVSIWFLGALTSAIVAAWLRG